MTCWKYRKSWNYRQCRWHVENIQNIEIIESVDDLLNEYIENIEIIEGVDHIFIHWKDSKHRTMFKLQTIPVRWISMSHRAARSKHGSILCAKRNKSPFYHFRIYLSVSGLFCNIESFHVKRSNLLEVPDLPKLKQIGDGARMAPWPLQMEWLHIELNWSTPADDDDNDP